MDDVMIIFPKLKYFKHPVNVFEVLIKFGLNILAHKYQFLRNQLTYMSLMLILEDEKPYTPMKGKCNVIIDMNLQKSVKEYLLLYIFSLIF